jgi:galactokinase
MLDIGPIHRMEYETETGQQEPVVIAEAPGRMHFLGEHGEPGRGLYLSAAIDRYARAAVSMRKDNSLRFFAADMGERKRTTLVNLRYKREDRWANYIKTAIQLFAELNCPVRGLNITVAADIPQQVGLASSSAIEVASAMALRGFFKISMTDMEMVKLLCAAHLRLFGVPADAVDYLLCIAARKDQFLIVDEASLEIRKIKSPLSRYRILVMDSRVPRMGVEDELASRRADLQKGLELLSQYREGLSFRDYAAADLMDSMGNLEEEIRRRSMHVVQEIRRVADAEDALRRKDFAALSRIFQHSHESLRDLYEVSCPEVDWLVKRAQELEGVAGSRMTGQGFGGCTFTIIRADLVNEYKKRLEDYERIFGFHPVIYEVKIATGSRLVSSGNKSVSSGNKPVSSGNKMIPA